MIQTYAEAVNFLYTHLPMFQRVGAAAIRHDLTNTLRLCALLDNPQEKFRSIHVAGTNGKGSSSHMLASVLQEAGFKTGLYTSPHLKSFTERIRVNGNPVREEFVLGFVNRMRAHIPIIDPSFFEITVAMAFEYFAQENVDFAVVETGLGGRLDSTNVITPVVALITNIGWDHKDLLGDTLEKIAYEKGGIIKQGVPAVVSERQMTIDRVFERRCHEVNAPLVFASDHYTVARGLEGIDVRRDGQPYLAHVDLPLLGFYQYRNLAGVLATIDILRSNGIAIGDVALRTGLHRVIDNTHLKGRWQVLSERPLIVCDTGHNIDGIQQVVTQIEAQSYNRLFVVFGMVRDKDVESVLTLLPRNAQYIFCEAKLPRAMPAVDLLQKAVDAGLTGIVVHDVNDAIRMARSMAGVDDFIFIGGSTFVVAEIDEL